MKWHVVIMPLCFMRCRVIFRSNGSAIRLPRDRIGPTKGSNLYILQKCLPRCTLGMKCTYGVVTNQVGVDQILFSFETKLLMKGPKKDL